MAAAELVPAPRTRSNSFPSVLRPSSRFVSGDEPLPAAWGSPGRSRILCFGDSLTAGFYAGGQAYEPYGRALSETLSYLWDSRCQVLVAGLSGLTAAEMVEEMENTNVVDVAGCAGSGVACHLREHSPELVIIMAGTNDLGCGQDPKAILKDIQELHLECHRRGICTVALAPSTVASGPTRAGRDELAKLLGAWAKDAPLVSGYVDVEELIPHGHDWSSLWTGESLWDKDGLHFSARGSQTLGHRLARHIYQMLDAALGAADLAEPRGMFSWLVQDFSKLFQASRL